MWRHLGREHQGSYAESIRRNPADVIDGYLRQKAAEAQRRGPNGFYEDDLLVELGMKRGLPYLIAYDERSGIQVSRGYKGDNWLIDVIAVDRLPDATVVIVDLFLDVEVVAVDPIRYRVLDLDEFATALEVGAVSPEVAAQALRSLHQALHLLDMDQLPLPAAAGLWDSYCSSARR